MKRVKVDFGYHVYKLRILWPSAVVDREGEIVVHLNEHVRIRQAVLEIVNSQASFRMGKASELVPFLRECDYMSEQKLARLAKSKLFGDELLVEASLLRFANKVSMSEDFEYLSDVFCKPLADRLLYLETQAPDEALTQILNFLKRALDTDYYVAQKFPYKDKLASIRARLVKARLAEAVLYKDTKTVCQYLLSCFD